MKSKVDKLDVDKWGPVPADLSKLNDVVKYDVVKNTECNAKIKDIVDRIPDITDIATNTTLNAKINEVKGEIPSVTNVATDSGLNAKMHKVKGKIPSITNLATTTALTAVENKIPNDSNLVKKNSL